MNFELIKEIVDQYEYLERICIPFWDAAPATAKNPTDGSDADPIDKAFLKDTVLITEAATHSNCLDELKKDPVQPHHLTDDPSSKPGMNTNEGIDGKDNPAPKMPWESSVNAKTV